MYITRFTRSLYENFQKIVFRMAAPVWTASTNTPVNALQSSAANFVRLNPWWISCTRKRPRANNTTANMESVFNLREATVMCASVRPVIQVENHFFIR